MKNGQVALVSKASLEATPEPVEFQYSRDEWVLFRSANTLPQKAGVPAHQLRRLVLKELADNALDAGGNVRVGQFEDEPDGFFVEDDGSGIPPEDVTRLFSINRPLISSKLLRLPRRGALGNGLRVVTGSVAASSGGVLRVYTRNRRLDLTPQADGSTAAVVSEVDHPGGTRVEIIFGREIPYDFRATLWADLAAQMNVGDTYGGRSSPWWYDADAFFELLQAAGARPVRSLVADLDGCTGGKAGRITAAFKGRSCVSLSRAEATALLEAAREQTRPVRPERLGAVGQVATLPEAYACERGTFNAGARAPRAVVPFVVEAWAYAAKGGVANQIHVFVNRTVATGEVMLWRSSHDKKDLFLSGCGLSKYVEFPKGVGLDVTVNVTTPYCPITTDGKEPELSAFALAIVAAIKKAGRQSYRETRGPIAERSSAKAVVLANLEAAIAKASGNGLYRFNQRQLYYVVRPAVMDTLGKQLSYGNFEGIISEYEAEHGEVPGMFRDPRGTLYHPHTRDTIPLGTLAVEDYQRPAWTFNKVLYIEKEGPFETLKAARWPERHDCCLVTSKGFASRATKDLLDLLADGEEPVTVYCIHDADAAGGMIYETLVRETRARPSRRRIEIVNLGLDPWEAMEMGLEVERVERRERSSPVAQYALGWWDWLQHSRVELNAMTTPQFIDWLDGKMAEHDGAKVIPPAHVLAAEMQASFAGHVRKIITAEALRKARIEERVQEAVRMQPRHDMGRLGLELADWLAEHGDELWRAYVDQVAHEMAARHQRDPKD